MRDPRSVVVALVLVPLAACGDCGGGGPDAGLDGGDPTGPLVVNELLARNQTVNVDEAGDDDDWIELFNRGDEVVDLAGHGLSDALGEPGKLVFGEGTVLEPGGFLLVWADGEPEEGPLHAPFRLSSSGEEVVLTAPDGAVLDRVPFGAQSIDVSIGRVPDGEGDFVVLQAPSPGAQNAPPGDAGAPLDSGHAEAGVEVVDAGACDGGGASARISEVLVVNTAFGPDEDGDFHPWIEVEATGAAPFDLSALSVSDDPAVPQKAPLSAVVADPSDLVVFYAAGDPLAGPRHLDLALTPSTPRLWLFDACGAVLDELELPAGPEADVSVGHGPDGGTIAFQVPTPGAANAPPRTGSVDAGASDAGAFDAGAFDAGAFDAGASDAGASDGG